MSLTDDMILGPYWLYSPRVMSECALSHWFLCETNDPHLPWRVVKWDPKRKTAEPVGEPPLRAVTGVVPLQTPLEER